MKGHTSSGFFKESVLRSKDKLDSVELDLEFLLLSGMGCWSEEYRTKLRKSSFGEGGRRWRGEFSPIQ